jgi:hypothetical protein
MLLHALLDGQLDAGQAVRWRHIWKLVRAARCKCVLIASCSKAMPAAQLCFTAPTGLRRRIALPVARPRTSSPAQCFDVDKIADAKRRHRTISRSILCSHK